MFKAKSLYTFILANEGKTLQRGEVTTYFLVQNFHHEVKMHSYFGIVPAVTG